MSFSHSFVPLCLPSIIVSTCTALFPLSLSLSATVSACLILSSSPLVFLSPHLSHFDVNDLLCIEACNVWPKWLMHYYSTKLHVALLMHIVFSLSQSHLHVRIRMYEFVRVFSRNTFQYYSIRTSCCNSHHQIPSISLNFHHIYYPLPNKIQNPWNFEITFFHYSFSQINNSLSTKNKVTSRICWKGC